MIEDFKESFQGDKQHYEDLKNFIEYRKGIKLDRGDFDLLLAEYIKEKGLEVNNYWTKANDIASYFDKNYNTVNLSRIRERQEKARIEKEIAEQIEREKEKKKMNAGSIMDIIFGKKKKAGVEELVKEIENEREQEHVKTYEQDTGFLFTNAIRYIRGELNEKEKEALENLIGNTTFYKIEVELPSKIEIYEDLDITVKDNVFVSFTDEAIKETGVNGEVFIINGNSRVIGFMELVYVEKEGKEGYYLTARKESIIFDEYNNAKFYLIFTGVDGKYYSTEVEMEMKKLEKTKTHLCIDFGTTNTTVGCYLSSNYVKNVSNIAKLNGTIELEKNNIVTFEDVYFDKGKKLKKITYKKLFPTQVYTKDVLVDEKNATFEFGYDAARRIKEDNYCPKATCFMEIKRWVQNLDKTEIVQDIDGDVIEFSRKEILIKFLLHVIKEAENQFKCKFEYLHISTPVKMKKQMLNILHAILEPYGYIVETDRAIDEGICVLYNIIDKKMNNLDSEGEDSGKALIIDCGGGTSDLASCTYKIEKEEGISDLKINTEYMNGDVNFGGNNLTFRIMQFMKIVYATHLSTGRRIDIDELIPVDNNSIFMQIEGDNLETDEEVQNRYKELYNKVETEYAASEGIIPTRFKEYENQSVTEREKVKNNFYFLWNLAEEMKKAFYKNTSVSRYSFNNDNIEDVDLKVKKIENWPLSVRNADGVLVVQKDYKNIIFNAKEIDKLLRGDIYYMIRKFLNKLYEENLLTTYKQTRLSGQSTKIGIFIDSLKEFLPGKVIRYGGEFKGKAGNNAGSNSEELKLLCVEGAIRYMRSIEKGEIQPIVMDDVQSIPYSVDALMDNSAAKCMIKAKEGWEQKAGRRRITPMMHECEFLIKSEDGSTQKKYEYQFRKENYTATDPEELSAYTNGHITQEESDSIDAGKHYVFFYPNKEKYGFDILTVCRKEDGTLCKGNYCFGSFDMDDMQETFFDGER